MGSQEFRFSNPRPGESPDLELWGDLLDESEIAEIRAIRKTRVAVLAGALYRAAFNENHDDHGRFAPSDGQSGSGLTYDKTVSPEKFIAARDASDRSGFLSPLAPEDLKDSKLFLTEDGKIGGALSPDGDMGNLFNNGGPKGKAAEVLLDMIAAGGTHADCFDGYLPQLYANFGLTETGRMTFNREFAPPNWDYKTYGTPDVVFLGLKKDAGTPDEIRSRVYGDRSKWTKQETTTKYYDDYEAGKRDSRTDVKPQRRGASDPSIDHQGSRPRIRRQERGIDSGSSPSDRGSLASLLLALFDPDQARDERGQWTSGGGGASSPDPHGIYVKADSFPHTRNDPSMLQTGALNKDGRYEGHGIDTLQQNSNPDKTLTPERQRLHEAIVSHFLAIATPQLSPIVNMTGGGAASGKSSMIGDEKNAGVLDLPNDQVHIDVDRIRALLPEYKEELAKAEAEGRRPSTLLAAYTHEESSKISKDLIQAAVKNGYNMLVDTVGDSGITKLTENVERMRSAGAPVHANYITMDVDRAIKGAEIRAEKPPLYRSVPESVLRAAHQDVTNTFVAAVTNNLFDHYTLWDNNGPKGSTPTKIVSGERGKPMVVHNAETWKRFLAKGESRHAAVAQAESYWYRIFIEVLHGILVSHNDSPVERNYRETVTKEIEAIITAGHSVEIPAELS
jgi:hypothetical protein